MMYYACEILLNTLLPKLLFTPVCTQWGVHLNPITFEYFIVEISVRNLHPTSIRLKQPYKLIYQQKEQSKHVSFQNGDRRKNFAFAKIVTWPKFWKNTFPKTFLNKIWLKFEKKKHEYISIFEIKIKKKKKSVSKWLPK